MARACHVGRRYAKRSKRPWSRTPRRIMQSVATGALCFPRRAAGVGKMASASILGGCRQEARVLNAFRVRDATGDMCLSLLSGASALWATSCSGRVTTISSPSRTGRSTSAGELAAVCLECTRTHSPTPLLLRQTQHALFSPFRLLLSPRPLVLRLTLFSSSASYVPYLTRTHSTPYPPPLRVPPPPRSVPVYSRRILRPGRTWRPLSRAWKVWWL